MVLLKQDKAYPHSDYCNSAVLCMIHSRLIKGTQSPAVFGYLIIMRHLMMTIYIIISKPSYATSEQSSL